MWSFQSVEGQLPSPTGTGGVRRRRRPRIRSAHLACAAVAVLACLTMGQGSASAGVQTPSIILDEGTLVGHTWQSGVRESRRRPCSWIRVRDGSLEVPIEWCGTPGGFPHFAAGLRNRDGHRRGTIELIVAPLAVTEVKLDLVGTRDRRVKLRRSPSGTSSVGVKRNFRFSARTTYVGRYCLRRATFYDANGVITRDRPGSRCGTY